MKLSEIKGERALDVIADLIDPVGRLLQDDQFKEIAQDKKRPRTDTIKYLLKEHKKTVIEILAVINGEDPKTYEPSLLSLPMMLMDLIDDPDVAILFGLQGQTTELASTGPATESTEAQSE